jgi:hypothetical protein
MAAINIRAAQLPTVYTFTSATTWQEVQLPPRCRVTVTVTGVAGVLAFTKNGDPASPEEPADGGAVGTHTQALPADSLVTFRMAPQSANPSGQSIFVAAGSGTPAVSVVLEALEN